MSTTAERKFLSLRRRLDQLGYRQPLGIETLPLVEQLFSDMIHTTESLRNAKLSAGKTEKEGRNFDALLEPYKTDNARVVKENNELHLALLRLKEDKDRVFRELKSHVRKQENDTTDLKFLNNQYVQKVRCLEKDSKTKSERIQQLQEKNMQAVVQTPGGKKRSIPFRRQRMQIDELTPPPATSAYPVPQPDDPYIADLLQMADMRIQELQEEIMMVKLDLEKSQDCMEQLNQQIQGSDKEVQRLNHALSGGRPHDVISLEAQNVSNEKMIAHLNLQIEYLQAANSSMEQKVEAAQQRKQDASSEFADLSVKNHELCQELSHIDHLAKQLEMDKELALQKAHQELQEAQKEIQRHQNTIEDLKNVIQTIRRDQSDGDYERNRLSDQLVEVQQQRDQLEGLGNFMEQDKARLQDKLEKMTANDRELVLELETMRAKHGICRKERSPSRLDAFVRSLEEERDHYRKVAEHYKRVRRPESLSLSPIRSPGQESSPNSRRRRSPGEAELVRVAKERDDLKSILLGIERHMEDIQTDVQALRVERDQLKAQLKQVSQSATLTERRQDERRIEELENNIKSLEQERRELRSQLLVLKENREAEEEELQTRSRALVHTAEELAQHRAESSNLRLLQEQMEHLLSDVQRRLSVKTNELHATQMHITQLEERLGALSGVGSSHKEEVAALHKSITALDQEKDTLQDEVDLKTERLVKLQEELARKEEPLDDLRITVTNMDNSLRQLKGCVGSRDRELASLRRQLDSAQGEVVEHGRAKDMVVRENRRLQEDLATLTRENQTLHAEMEEAMHEKDELKSRVLSYISEVARIEKLITTKEQESQDLLERFRLAHTTLEERDQKLQQAQGLTSSIRLELLSSDTERRHLRQTISHQETEIQQHMHALQAYDAQVSSLARGMARLEEDLKGAQEEKAALLSDLASVRELCVKLDSGKELTACHLTSKSMELERLTGELDDVRSEGELLKKQLASERQTAHNLEALLSNNRQKEFQSHLSASEKESELRVLRERLALADSKTLESPKPLRVYAPPWRRTQPRPKQNLALQDYFELPPLGPEVSDTARSFIAGLVCEREERLGSGGFGDFRGHPFFCHLDWSALHKLPAPYLPEVADATDTANFDVHDDCLSDMETLSDVMGRAPTGVHLAFVGYSYTATSQTGAVDRSLDIMLEIDHSRLGENERLISAEKLLQVWQDSLPEDLSGLLELPLVTDHATTSKHTTIEEEKEEVEEDEEEIEEVEEEEGKEDEEEEGNEEQISGLDEDLQGRLQEAERRYCELEKEMERLRGEMQDWRTNKATALTLCPSAFPLTAHCVESPRDEAKAPPFCHYPLVIHTHRHMLLFHRVRLPHVKSEHYLLVCAKGGEECQAPWDRRLTTELS